MPRPRQKNTHNRQRQRLIDACISALHLYGPSRTTVEKVVAIARLSQGIVRFYFASKASMLVASLQFLATEFEDQVLAPVSRLKDKPVAALKLLVDLYLDPELASPRKVSVWYAFWGEASSRQEYYDICGQKDEGFAALVREIIDKLIVKSGQVHLDADGVALGLIGVLEMLWQEIAFKDEAEIKRQIFKERAMAYLRSVFPGHFSDAGGSDRAVDALPTWVYANTHLFAMERERIFQHSWQFAAHQGQLKVPGDFVSDDLGFERVLLLYDAAGKLRAFRNCCPVAPHALIAPGVGRLRSIACAVHGLTFGLDGAALRGPTDLLPMEVTRIGDLLLIRAADLARGSDVLPDRWHELKIAPLARALPVRQDAKVAADWKIVAELFLSLVCPQGGNTWSARHYQSLTSQPLDYSPPIFLPPNHWMSIRRDGWTLRQILPLAAGLSSLRQLSFSWRDDAAGARAAEYLAERSPGMGRMSVLQVAESIQHGIVNLGYRSQQRCADVIAFHSQLLSALPLMTFDQAPSD